MYLAIFLQRLQKELVLLACPSTGRFAALGYHVLAIIVVPLLPLTALLVLI
jgi:hypothetical protein